MSLPQQLQATLGATYTVTRELGGGGMSRVFVAHDESLNRDIAVKVLPEELAAGVNVDRFRREILLAAQLQHPHIVPVLSAGETDGLPYYTMPFVHGESLRERLARGPLAITDAVSLLREIARALAYAHARGVVHRDIKPDNVLISGGSAVVADFGIAKAISAARITAPGGTLTQVGTSIGTPAYMAPEQAAGDPATDQRADLYALGCVAYEVLTGRAPFVDKSPHKLLTAHMTETPALVTTLRPDAPVAISDLVARLLAKSPDDRPQSADEVIRVLDSAGSSSAATPSVVLGGPGMFGKALAIYAMTVIAVAIMAKAAIVGIGLPDWVFPGALLVMALGLPVLLWTGYVQRVSRHAMTMTPTFTPGGHSVAVTQGTLAGLALKAAPKMSWSRTARGGAYALGVFVVLVGVFMAMRALGIGPVGTLFASGKLKATDHLVLTDFASTNGDSSVARAASIAVRAALQQSTLEIMDPATVAAVLERMERPRTSRIDLATAREVAIREGAKAIIDGEVTAVGNGYLLTLRLVTADSGKTLGTFPASANGLEGLIPAADRVVKALRSNAGESLRLVQNAVPLARAQTASLEALRLYGDVRFANDVEQDFPKAVRLARAAVAIDSSFARAWQQLAAGLSNLGSPRAQIDSAGRRSYALAHRLPAGEQGMIIGGYFGMYGGRDRAKAIDAYQQAIQLGYNGVRNNLAVQLWTRREFAKADSLMRAAAAADTTRSLAVSNLLWLLIDEGRLDAADSLVAVATRRFPSSLGIRQRAITQAFFHGRLESYQQQLDSARAVRDPRDPPWAYARSSELALLRGDIGQWRAYKAKMIEADSSVGRSTLPVTIAAQNVLVASRLRGSDTPELKAFDEALAKSKLTSLADADRPDLDIALNLALAGHDQRARALLSSFQSTVRDTTVLRGAQSAVHTTLGAIAAAQHKLPEALRELRRGDNLPDGPANDCTLCLSLYLGHAFDAANQPDSAIAAYESYARLPMSYRYTEAMDASSLPGVHERLGQLYEAKGDAQKAVEHYRAFIELWKNADSEFQPRVAAARRSVARLTAAEKR